MDKFLIVKTSAIGDVAQCLHLINYLKRRCPCHIDWVVEKVGAPLVRAHPSLDPKIDRVLEIDIKKWRKHPVDQLRAIGAFIKKLRKKNYTALFDLQGNTKSACITALSRAQKKVGYSWKSLPEKTNFFFTTVHIPLIRVTHAYERYERLLLDFFGDQEGITLEPISLRVNQQEEERLQEFVKLWLHRPSFMVCFGSHWPNKQLKESTLHAFLSLVQKEIDPLFVFVYGNEEEKKVACCLKEKFPRSSHVEGRMSLPLWQRSMECVDGVIAVDSAALHLCATTSTPSFGIFGPSSSLVYKPPGERHVALQGKCPYHIAFEKRCPQLRSCPTGSCIKDLDEREIFGRFQIFWSRVSQSRLAPTS